jgi:hypothetical protein
VLFIHNVCSTKIVSYDESDILGFASKLNFIYWVGLSLAVISVLIMTFSIRKSHDCGRLRLEVFFLFELFLVALYLNAIVLMEENISFGDSWLHAGSSITVSIYGRFDQPLSSYAKEYPGIFMFMSIFSTVSQIPLEILMKLHTLMFSLFYVLFSYILIRKIINDKVLVCVASLIFTTGGVWVLPQSFSPSSLAFVLYMLILYFAFSKGSGKTLGLSIFLAFVTAISHPTTLPFLILSTALIPLSLKFAYNKNFLNKKASEVWSLPLFYCIFVLIIWFGWCSFHATSQFEDIIHTISNFIFSLNKYFSVERTTERLHTTTAHGLSQLLKIYYTLVYVALGFIGFAYLLRKVLMEKRKEATSIIFISIGWFAACGILGFIIMFLYGGEFVERVILFGLIPMAILGAFTYKPKYGRTVFVISILIGAHLAVFAAYTNQYFIYPKIDQSIGCKFIIENGYRSLSFVKAEIPTGTIYRFYLYTWTHNHSESAKSPANLIAYRVFIWSEASERFYYFYVKDRPYAQLSYAQRTMQWIENYRNMTFFNPDFNIIYNNEGVNIGLMRLKQTP